ncbi:hypothetical protein DKK70_16460 [Gilliamella apicola]|uniref:Uncharacterized protein n=1 Tax=Gilliamella apicola TaxID=1196095 RepID=A0A2V4DRC4_9GAMM|nr:hypothetical protein [Gilliamella apicola]PXZ03140.1 hypothetical protein DKK70_16460 [Gilliamella apicola]
MAKTTYNNPYHPYPYEMRGQFAEKQEKDKTRFFEIDSYKYDKEKIKRLKENDLFESSYAAMCIEQLNSPITDSDSVFYLYKFETYYADPNQDDIELFNESSDCYETYYFQNIDELLEFANHKWGLVLSDFVPSRETHFPLKNL